MSRMPAARRSSLKWVVAAKHGVGGLFSQLSGTKRFTLFPPGAHAAMRQQALAKCGNKLDHCVQAVGLTIAANRADDDEAGSGNYW